MCMSGVLKFSANCSGYMLFRSCKAYLECIILKCIVYNIIRLGRVTAHMLPYVHAQSPLAYYLYKSSFSIDAYVYGV